eukprot:m.477695 g.477695  ORF g.477695 m.477695 type:complete len:394 (-) comp20921_c0_seq1:357-1538(-)
MRRATTSCLIAVAIAVVASGGDVRPRAEGYTPEYSKYLTVEGVSRKIHTLVTQFPLFVKARRFSSLQGRPILALMVANHTLARVDLLQQTQLFFSSGEHAREFLPVEVTLGFVEHVVSGALDGTCSWCHTVINSATLVVVPLLNPDGRAHIERTTNYCWRGTSRGVDINRNFQWNFGGQGASRLQTDEEYCGTAPLSEPESRVLVTLATAFAFDGFLSLHSGIKQVYVPYADSISRKTGSSPLYKNLMLAMARRMAQAAAGFTSGPAETLNTYAADGTVFDYMAGVQKIPVALAVELWGTGDGPDRHCFDLFNPAAHDLEEVVASLIPLLRVFVFDVLAVKSDLMAARLRQQHETYGLSVATAGCLLSLVALLLACSKLKVAPRCRLLQGTRR